ncbi:MAG: Cna B-type domain-containing protein, partial [Firmicutes bacterium]|nr:Cna B-type domain-containing protein [Bacillota bacterium]
MDRLKRIATLILTLCLIVTTIPTSAFAADAVVANQIGNYFDADNETGALPSQPTLEAGNTQNSYADGAVVVDKTIEATGVENEFKVKLSVQTTESINETISSPDVATVVVIDVSTSMQYCVHEKMSYENGHERCKSKMTLAKEAAQDFINNYVDPTGESDRKIAIVKFSGPIRGSVDGARRIQDWISADQIDTANSTIFCEAIDDLTQNGGTNIEAGLILAKNLLNQTVLNRDNEPITNKNVILFTDGEPTLGVRNAGVTDSTEVICPNSQNSEGNAGSVRCYTHGDIEPLVDDIKAIGATPYAIYVGSKDIDCQDCSLDKPISTWLSDCGFTAYATDNADQITEIFKAILELIELKAQAWEATDPMGSAVDHLGFERTPNPANEFIIEDETINWDLKGAIPAKTETVGGITKYTYELEYTIKLDNLQAGYEAGKYYATNGTTEVTYVVTKNDNGKISYEDGVAYFNVPSVKGFEGGSFEFIKVDATSGNPIKGAGFTLSTDGWSRTVTTGADGVVSFSNIPSGHTYTLTETTVPEGYEAVGPATVTVSYGEVTITGLDIVDGKVADPNKTTSISGSKTWNDDSNRDGKRPDSIKINLLADGNVKETKTVTAADGWKWTFTNLPTHIDGKAVNYKVTEEAVAGYTTEVSGYNVTNSYVPEKVKVEGTKTWEDNDNQDGVRPDSVTINLLANGTPIDSKEVTAADGWTYVFDDLYKYEAGKEIIYTVTEDAVADYQTTYGEDYSVVNTHTPEKIAINGTKVWDDNNDQDGKRPDSITVRVHADGKEVASKTVTEDDNWTWSFTNLPKYRDGGIEVVYTVTEDAVAEYETTVVKGDDGYKITNTHTPAKTSVSGSKTWNDNNDQDGKRPDSITVTLLANGKNVEGIEPKVVSAEDGWTWTFTNLDKYANGEEIVYTVTEEAVAGYEAEFNGLNITNTHEPEKTSVDVKKVWDDANNQDGKRPGTITVTLLADGNEDKSVELSDENNWEYNFTNLDKYANGEEIVYTVTE